MKRIRICAWVLLVFMILTALPLSASAEGEANGDVEVILLFDMSGSMNKSDPDKNGVRLSIEAAYQFVFNYPTKTNMFVTVVPYNSNVYEGFKKVNVKDEKGRKEFGDQMEALRNNTVSDFTCWESNTDIGSALDVAKTRLDASDVGKKAIILFTDGKIELTSKDKITTAESVEKALSNSSAIRDQGIHIYSIGLNCNGAVDRNQLESISGAEDVRIVNSAADLSGMFTEVYTELFDNSYLDENTDEFEVSPDTESVCDIRIYGQAVKEANISLSSGAPLHKLVVTAPNGYKVADIDFRDPTAGSVDETYCVIQNTPSAYTATIKLVEPMDGDWKVTVTGEKSTVITRKIYLFDLEARTDITASEYYIEDTFEYTAAIYNSVSGVHLTSTGLYAKEDGGEAVVNVIRKGVNGQTPYVGELNASQNGYVFKIDFEASGEYTLETTIKHEQFETTTTNTIKVVGPKLAIDNKIADGKFTINTSFVHPNTSAPISKLPNAFLSQKLTVSILCNGKEVHSVTNDVSKLTDGKFSFEYAPIDSGKYEIVAKLSSGEEFKTNAFDFKAPERPKVEIKVEDELPDDITERGFSGSFEKDVDLKGAFKLVNSDEKLAYSVKIEGDDSFTAEVVDGVLKIKSDGFGEAKLTLTVSGGGVSHSHEIELASKSFWPIIIIIVVSLIVIAVLIVIAIIVIRKKQIISIAFKFKIEDRSVNSFNPTFAVYEVARLSNKKNAKPSMTLEQILNSNGYAQMEMGATMDPQALGAFMDKYAGRITLTGVPFKKAFKIVYKGEDGKTRTMTFKHNNLSFPLGDNCDIVFGNSHANF